MSFSFLVICYGLSINGTLNMTQDKKEENGLFTMGLDIKIRIHFWLPPPQTIFFTKGIDSMCSHNKLNAVERMQYI